MSVPCKMGHTCEGAQANVAIFNKNRHLTVQVSPTVARNLHPTRLQTSVANDKGGRTLPVQSHCGWRQLAWLHGLPTQAVQEQWGGPRSIEQ